MNNYNDPIEECTEVCECESAWTCDVCIEAMCLKGIAGANAQRLYREMRL